MKGLLFPESRGPRRGHHVNKKRGSETNHKNVAAFCQFIAHENGHFLSVVYIMMPDRGPVYDHLRPFSLFKWALVIVLQVKA